jgi:hypothetical protein
VDYGEEPYAKGKKEYDEWLLRLPQELMHMTVPQWAEIRKTVEAELFKQPKSFAQMLNEYEPDKPGPVPPERIERTAPVYPPYISARGHRCHKCKDPVGQADELVRTVDGYIHKRCEEPSGFAKVALEQAELDHHDLVKTVARGLGLTEPTETEKLDAINQKINEGSDHYTELLKLLNQAEAEMQARFLKLRQNIYQQRMKKK